MDRFIDFFNFRWLKKIDKYFLLNHTLIWNIKLPYIVFYSLLTTLILIFIDLSPSQISKVSLYSIWFIVLLYIYWLYTQKNYITMVEYSTLKLNGSKEYFIYLFSTIIFFLPILIMTIVLFNTFDNYNNAQELKEWTFIDNQYRKNCNSSDEELSCISDKTETLNNIVIYLNSGDILTKASVTLAKKQIESVLTQFGIAILIIFFIPFQIIFFRYGGVKNYIYMLLFSFIYLIIYAIFIQKFQIYTTSIKWILYLLGLIIIFFTLVNSRLIILFHLLLFFIIISVTHVGYFLENFNNDERGLLSMLVVIVIQLIIFGLITKYLVYLISQPKE